MTISAIYYVSIILLFICSGVSSLFKNKKLVACILSCLVLGLLLGLRDPLVVGVDGIRYARTYEGLAGKDISSIFSIKDNANIFFYFLNWLLSNIGVSFQIFSMLSGFFCTVVISYFIYRFSDMPLLSFMLYIGLGFYTFAFSGQKEAMAMALVILSCIALFDRKIAKSWIFYILAVLSHYTAIVFLPILLISRSKISKKVLKYLLIAAIPAAIAVIYFRVSLARWITSTFAEHYLDRYTITESLGGTFLFAIAFTLLYIFSIGLFRSSSIKQGGTELVRQRYVELSSFERIILYVCIASCIIQVFSSYAYAFTRLAFYYLQFFVVSIPYSLKTDRIKRFLGRYYTIIMMIMEVVLMGLMIYMFFAHIEGERIQEYKFIWEMR